MEAKEKAKELLCNECAIKVGCDTEHCFVFGQMMAMHEWDKQQFIEKACEWLKDNEFGFETADEAIIAFKKAM